MNGQTTGAAVPLVKSGDLVSYTIVVRNEGKLPGHVEEITDRVPSGLEFVESYNPGWTYDIQTREAKTTVNNDLLINPGGTVSVTITLVVGSNLTAGTRLTNIAEISKHSDENHDPIKDDDSTPGNKVPGEDDQDDAVVEVIVPGGGGIDPTPPKKEEEKDDGGDGDGDGEEEGEQPPTEVDETEEPDEDDDTPDVPGGNDHSVPPIPTHIGNTLVPTDDGSFIEYDEDGVPLGEWHWDDVEEMWIFEEYPPLSETPVTGDSWVSVYSLALSILSLGGIIFTLVFGNRKRIKRGKV